MPILFRDYETRSTLNLKRVGSYKYAGHPTTDVWCSGYAVDDGPVQIWLPGDPVPPEFVEAAKNPDWIVSAFNDGFERSIERFIMAPRYGWPAISIERHRCTQAAAQALALPASLAKAAEALGLEQHKDVAGQTLMKQMARPRKPKKGEDPNNVYWFDDIERRCRLYEYCKHDVVVERALYGRIGHLSDAEQSVWILDSIINSRGIHIDRNLVTGAISIGEATQAAIDAELCVVTGGEVSTTKQTEKLIAWLVANGAAVDDVRKETVSEALERTDLPGKVRRVLELRRDGAHIAAAKFKTMMAWAAADDRIHGAHKYHQAATGRWASHGVQMQNLKKSNGLDVAAAVKLVTSGDLGQMRQHYDNPLEVVGETARAAIIAAPGHRLIIADFSGIESRVLAFLAEEQSKLDLWRQYDQTGAAEDDPYFKLGKQFGFADDVARAKGKTADLAFGYSGGEGAFRKFAGETASSEEANTLKRNWRNAHPKTVGMWADLDAVAKRAVANPNMAQRINDHLAFCFDGTFLRMKLPSGRCLAYPFPRLEPGRYPDETVVHFKDNAAGKFVDCRNGQGAWQGLWVENAVQAVARDLLVVAMQRLEAAGYRIVMHVHDEIVAEVPQDFGSEEEFLRIMTEAPVWAAGLPIAAKARSGPRFCKTSEAIDSNMQVPFDDPIPRFITESPPIAPTTEPGSWAEEEDTNSKYKTYSSGEREWGNDVAECIYKDARGRPYLKVKRTSRKQFPQYHLEGERWVKGSPTGPKIPYRLPELMNAPRDAWVHIFEGEKDADNGAVLGLVATTHSEGAEGWSDDLVPWFIGRRIVIHEDNDDSGRKRTRTIAAALKSAAKEIRVLKYEDLPEKGDFSDWLERGHILADLQQRVESTPAHEFDLEEWDAGEDDGDGFSAIPSAASFLVRCWVTAASARLRCELRSSCHARSDSLLQANTYSCAPACWWFRLKTASWSCGAALRRAACITRSIRVT
jgi:DNA polymerase bacteriophage-type